MMSTAAYVIEDLGRAVGIPDLALDEAGLVTLDVDGTSVTLEWLAEGSVLVYGAVLSDVDAADGNLLARVLDASTASSLAGYGSLGRDADARTILYIERHATEGLDQGRLQRAIVSALQKMGHWAEVLGRRADAQPASDDYLSLAGSMIRV